MSKPEDEAGDEANRHSAERVKIRQGLDEARSVLECGGDLPAYLTKALIRYEAAFWKGVEERLILPKLVREAHEGNPPYKKNNKRLPLSKQTTQGEGAYEKAGNALGVSASTAERAYNEYPPPTDPMPTKHDLERRAKKKARSEQNRLRLLVPLLVPKCDPALPANKKEKSSKR